MRIAQVPPLYEAVPPRFYGGTERVVSHLTDALVDLGHQVTLFASAEAQTKAQLVKVRDQAIRLDPVQLKSDLAAHMSMLWDVRRRADEFDIIHFHTDMLHFPFFEDVAEKTLTTLHGRLDLADMHPLYSTFSEAPLVSISDNQRKPMPPVNWAGRIHHGLPQNLLKPLASRSGDYLAFLGRISPEKRPDRAIEIAARSGRELRIAAKIDKVDRDYWREEIEPLLRRHAHVRYIGEIGDAEKAEFLGNAAALLFPIDWAEPFGLVMIEAMACGTPVIAWKCGSVPEVVDPGVTGFVVDSVEEAVSAVSLIGNLDRRRIREVFDQRFTAARMARDYVAIYRRLLEGGAPLSQRADARQPIELSAAE